jgi:hypothetical protein
LLTPSKGLLLGGDEPKKHELAALIQQSGDQEKHLMKKLAKTRSNVTRMEEELQSIVGILKEKGSRKSTPSNSKSATLAGRLAIAAAKYWKKTSVSKLTEMRRRAKQRSRYAREAPVARVIATQLFRGVITIYRDWKEHMKKGGEDVRKFLAGLLQLEESSESNERRGDTDETKRRMKTSAPSMDVINRLLNAEERERMKGLLKARVWSRMNLVMRDGNGAVAKWPVTKSISDVDQERALPVLLDVAGNGGAVLGSTGEKNNNTNNKNNRGDHMVAGKKRTIEEIDESEGEKSGGKEAGKSKNNRKEQNLPESSKSPDPILLVPTPMNSRGSGHLLDDGEQSASADSLVSKLGSSELDAGGDGSESNLKQ